MTLDEECIKMEDILRTQGLIETNLELLDEEYDPVIKGTTRELAIHYHELTGNWYHRQNHLSHKGYSAR